MPHLSETKLVRTSSMIGGAVSRTLQAIVSALQQALAVGLLIFCIVILNWIFGTTVDQSHLNPVDSYGYFGTILLYCLRSIPYLSVPFGIINILGLVTMNTFPAHPILREAKTKIPFMCFRVVTRGLYPELVKRNVDKNIEICYKVGFENFKFEVVTDKTVNLPKSGLIRELVVPSDYTTPRHSLFKARALHYCNEGAVNILSNDDWVVHLDEETLLTESSAIGLANFASRATADIGQGVITYANEEIVNWWTTLADSVRVSVDLGMMRFCFHKLKCPLMGFKGSYIIVKECVEKNIGFDFGPKGSVAEDVMFALVAWGRGYTFGFVDGEMWEKSPFTLGDYIKQRRRWFIGHMFVLLSSEIPIKCKVGMIPTDLGWFLLTANILNFPASILFPIPLPLVLNVTAGSLGGLILFLFIFGSIKSFNLRKYGLLTKVLIVLATVPIIPLAACLDAVASVYGFYTRNSVGFHIVNKDSSSNAQQKGNII